MLVWPILPRQGPMASASGEGRRRSVLQAARPMASRSADEARREVTFGRATMRGSNLGPMPDLVAHSTGAEQEAVPARR